MSTLRTCLKFGSFAVISTLTHAAWAQECNSDADCPSHYRCDHAPTSGSSSGSSGSSNSGSAEDVSGAANTSSKTERPTGGGDDPASGGGSTSGSGGGSSSSSGSGGQSGSAPDAPVDIPRPTGGGDELVAPTPSGQCEPAPYLCATNADCPNPTYCNNGECQLKLVFCDASTVCGANNECTKIGGSSCTESSAPASAAPNAPSNPAAPSQDPGASDSSSFAAPPPPSDPKATQTSTQAECTESSVSVCFPKAVACATDSECPAGWGCETVRPGGPDSFDGIERACLPPGIAALMNNEVEVDEDSAEKLGAVGGSDKSEDGSSEPTAGGLNPEVGGDGVSELGTQGGSEGKEACSVAQVGTRGGALAWLSFLPGLAALGLLRGRRRNAI